MLATLTAVRLLQLELEESRGDDWWLHPPEPAQSRPSVLDVERLLRGQPRNCGKVWRIG
ncbi:MAG: hypothetical protein U0797_26065 [Gemmataceae bacterium]